MAKKTIDTLVEDIYEKINELSEGNALKISESTYEDFGKAMADALRHWAIPQNRDNKEKLRMSNIGKPERRLWYDLHSESDLQEKIPPHLHIKFLYGHLLEVLILFFVRLAGHTVTDEQKEISVLGIKGHMDCVIDGEVMDVKTTSGFAFKKFKEGTLAEDDAFGYLSQLAGYEAAQKTENGGFLVMNKETGELATYIPDDMEKPNIRTKIKNVKVLMKKETPPDFCYAPVAEGKAGNMKLPRECTWCPHKFECHKDSNNGKGLRAFNYAKGPIYFTQIVKEPNVEEIL